jgi:alpha-L-arabinofuranosidase
MLSLCAAASLALGSCSGVKARSSSAASVEASEGITTIEIRPEVLHSGIKRFGINLSGQTFYDSGQMLRNLTFRNPGFEGETWQSSLRCKAVTADSCMDEQHYSTWPDHFLDGATFEVLTGAVKGTTGEVRSSAAPANGHGIVLSFADPVRLAKGDFLLVRMEKPGDAQAGWWTRTDGGATLATEFHDLSPATPGKQALRVDASADGQRATISSYFDSSEGRSFVQLRGRFTLRFRAKSLSGPHTLPVSLSRGSHIFLGTGAPLTPLWKDYHFEFNAAEDGSARGTVGLTFTVEHSSVLLDDVELVPINAAQGNATAFRDEVVTTLRDLRPGILRFMDNGTSFGSTLDDLLAPPFARRRGGSLLAQSRAEDIPIGLHESLALAQAIHAEPWYTLPATLTPAEATHLIEYLTGSVSTPYGARRAALGQPAPWTSAFPIIHLEFGNEMWGTSPGATIADPAAYASRAAEIFSAMRSAPDFDPQRFDLIGDAQAENTWWTPHTLAIATGQNSIGFAPYLFGSLNDVSSTEAIFGAMLAEPEKLDTTGIMAEQARLARHAAYPAAPAVYEVNLGTVTSRNAALTQRQIDTTVASTGAGVAVAEHMLLMLRELGITDQCLFALPEFGNSFNIEGHAAKTTPLWGAVVDMGGATNLRRPVFYTLQLANRALQGNELATHLTGANPTWDQPASTNGNVKASTPHLLQVFAFADEPRRSLVLFNLSRDRSLPVNFAGSQSPSGMVTESRFTSPHIDDTNEHELKAATVTHSLRGFNPAASYKLPPFSMTVLEWQARP